MNNTPPPPTSNAPPPAIPLNERPALRRHMRRLRRALNTAEQKDAADQLARQVWRSSLFRRSRHIAFYLANDGELDLTPLFHHAWGMRKTCYLPVITPGKRLLFTPFQAGDPLTPNAFGIPEPAGANLKYVDAKLLDLLLMPLVAFDAQGNRLGMGGGFYDRSLAFLRQRQHWRKPRLLGIAHDFQRVGTLVAQDWDVPLDAIATDTQLYLP